MRLFNRAVLVGGTALSVLILPTIAEAWHTSRATGADGHQSSRAQEHAQRHRIRSAHGDGQPYHPG